ncbi:hypothetical protein DDK01_17895 [Mycobacteroides abscessus]|nr:hypothetical protein DDK01_17895 [Mycobacteroides abscessus]
MRRDPPDLRKLSRAVIALALAEMEAENTPATNPETAEPDRSQRDTDQSNHPSGLVPDASEDDGVRP